MSIKKIVSVLGLFSALVFGLVGVNTLVPVSAQSSFSVSLPTGIAKSVTTDSVTKTVSNIANIIIGLVAITSVFFIIWGAIQWMNEGAEKGQKTVVNAVIGLVIAILAFFIVGFVTGAGSFLNTQLNQ